MEINTLVTHKYLSSLGIGVISDKLKTCVKVRFGENHKCKLKPEDLRPVDISKCKTITDADWKSMQFNASNKTKFVIIKNHLHRFNGIGWMYERSINQDDLMKYLMVVSAPMVMLNG